MLIVIKSHMHYIYYSCHNLHIYVDKTPYNYCNNYETYMIIYDN